MSTLLLDVSAAVSAVILLCGLSATLAHADSASHPLQGKRVAVLVDDGFEEVEMTEPRKALEGAGAQTLIVSPEKDEVKAWNHTEWGGKYKVDIPLSEARPDRFDALLLPGGVMNPDKLRMNPAAVSFVKAFFEEHKPVAAICHGPWTLIEAGVVRGRKLTSWPSLKTDIRNAGGQWEDKQVVVDDGLVTSRKPADIPAFDEKMLELFAGESTASAVKTSPAK